MKIKLILFWVIIIVQIICSSCGLLFDDKNKRKYDLSGFEGQDFDACVNSYISELEIVDNILAFEKKASRYVESVKRDNHLLSRFINDSLIAHNQVYTALSPLRMSKQIVENNFSDIKNSFLVSNKLEEIYDEINNYGDYFPDMDHSQLKEFSNILANLSNLKHIGVRLKGNYCKKRQLEEERKYNILPFISVKKWGNEPDEERFFNLAKNEISEGLYQYFFKVNSRNSGLEIKCKKNNDKYELGVYLYETSLREREQIKDAILSYWKNEKVSFAIHNSSSYRPGVLRVKKVNSYASYVVLSSSNIINLGIKNSTYYQKLALAHEFGHTIGFNDCYVEYYDGNLDGYVYYVLNKYNLMCTTNNLHHPKIPRNYLKQLVKRYCL